MTVQVKIAWHTPLSKRTRYNAVGGALEGTEARRTNPPLVRSASVPPRWGRDRGTEQAASRPVRPWSLPTPGTPGNALRNWGQYKRSFLSQAHNVAAQSAICYTNTSCLTQQTCEQSLLGLFTTISSACRLQHPVA